MKAADLKAGVAYAYRLGTYGTPLRASLLSTEVVPRGPVGSREARA